MELIRKIRLCIQLGLTLLGLFVNFIIYKCQRNKLPIIENDIRGKCVIVTGGSIGIGKSCAREFARRGAVVVIGDKNVEGGQKTVDEIRKVTGNDNVTILALDLSDLDSVEEFAKNVATNHPKIMILLNNAGIGGSGSENIKTKEGFNIHVAVNYMGHFLLTHLLLDNIKAEKNSRIVSMSSTCLLDSQLNLNDLNMDEGGFGFLNLLPYNNSKCMLSLMTKELGKRNQVKAYAICPGLVRTGIFSSCHGFLKLTFNLSLLLFSSTTDEAASEFVMHSALDKSLESENGKMYRFRKVFARGHRKLESYSEKDLYESSVVLVRLEERLARVNNSLRV